MSLIVFFEKPGCAGNARQRALLQAAGHALAVRDLLSEPWSAEALLAFLQPLPVGQWFNRASRRIKNGEVDPDSMDAGAAIALLAAEPALIRRPLMQREDGARMVGFDLAEVHRFVGLATSIGEIVDLEGCAGSLPRAVDVAIATHHEAGFEPATGGQS